MKKTEAVENRSGWLIGGGIIAAVGASLCCVGPLILTVLGISGAAALTKFDVLRIPMILIVVVFFAVAGLSLYKKRTVCEPGSICADPVKYKRMVWAFWIGLVIAALGISSPYWVVWLFG